MNSSPLEVAFGRRLERDAKTAVASGAFRGIPVRPIARWVLLGLNAAVFAGSGLVAGLVWLLIAISRTGTGPMWVLWMAALPPTLCAASSLWTCWQVAVHARLPWAVQATGATAFLATYAALLTLSV